MAVTRDQARRLLSDSEMTLFSESRNPALRALTAIALTRRVERTRKLREKSRDLLQRQRLGSRTRTGNKGGARGTDNERTQRKAEVLEDILQRFEGRLQEVQHADDQTTASRARKPVAAKTAAAKKRAPQRATQAPVPTARKSAGSKPATSGSSRARKTTASGTPATAAAPTKPRRPRKRSISPEQALAQTRELLEAKHQRNRQPPAYRMLDAHAEPGQPEPGYQSGTAKEKAQELHAGEVRFEPIHGSVSTRGRQSQGKRDHR